MSTLNTRSSFYYGHTVTTSNRYINFSEDGTEELTAILALDDYTLTEFCAEVERAMNAAGGQTYTVTFSRTTGVVTITGAGTFQLWIATGTYASSAAFTLLGFTGVVNLTGAAFYAGNARSGSVYTTQWRLEMYISPDDWKVLESSTVNVSAKGLVQVINFGEGSRMQCNITMITNVNRPGNSGFNHNASGLADARTFMRYLMTKAKVEFMPDYATPATFFSLLLDSSPAEKDGTGFILKNLAVDVYETGKLVFREVQD